MQPQLTHICLHVDKLSDCVDFYRHYCGLTVLSDRSQNGEGSVYLARDEDSPGPVLQLKSGGKRITADPSDDSHLGYAVGSRAEVDAVAAQAKKDGILFFEADEYLPGAYFCAILDPNGNCVEFSFAHPVPPD